MSDMSSNIENQTQSPTVRRISRRDFLKGMIAGGTAIGLSMLGVECGSDGKPLATSTLEARGRAGDIVKEPTDTPVAEATPTVDHDKLPYEIGWRQTFGKVTLSIQKEAMLDHQEPNPNNGLQPITVPGIHEIYLNTEEFPDAEAQLNNAVQVGIYNAWKTAEASRQNITYEQYKEKLSQGEDLTFTIKGMQGDSIVDLSTIVVDPNKEVEFVFVANGGNQLQPWKNNIGVGYREVKEKLYIEIYDWTGGGRGEIKNSIPSAPLYESSAYISAALAWMSQPSVQTEGKLDASQVNAQEMQVMEKLTVPYMNGDVYHGIVLAK